MRTKNHGPSLFSSLGEAFNLHHSPKTGILAVRRDPRVTSHEYFIAENLFILLDSLSTQKRVSFSWLQQVVVFVNSTISRAQELLPTGIHSPLSQWDEEWVSSYLEDTVKLLDVLNFVRKLVVELEHKQMLLKLVVSTLVSRNGTPEERRVKAQKCLVDYEAGSQVKPAGASKLGDFSTLLQAMIPQGVDERSNPLQRGRTFLTALYGAKVISVVFMGVIVRALGGTQIRGFTEWQVPERFAWSKPLEELLQLVNKLLGDEDRKNPGVHELFLLNLELNELRIKLESSNDSGVQAEQGKSGEIKLESGDSGFKGDTGGGISSSAWRLQIALKNSEEGVDSVRKELDNLFHVVVSSRNSLLGRLRGS